MGVKYNGGGTVCMFFQSASSTASSPKHFTLHALLEVRTIKYKSLKSTHRKPLKPVAPANPIG